MSYQMAYSAPLYDQQQQTNYPSPAPSPNHYQQQFPLSYEPLPGPYQQPQWQNPQPCPPPPQGYLYPGYQDRTYFLQPPPQQQQQQRLSLVPEQQQQQQYEYQHSAVPPPAVPAHLIVPSQPLEPYPQEPVFPQVTPPAVAASAPQSPQSPPSSTPQPLTPITPRSNIPVSPGLISRHPATPAIISSANSSATKNWPSNFEPAAIFESQIPVKDGHNEPFIPQSHRPERPSAQQATPNPYIGATPAMKHT